MALPNLACVKSVVYEAGSGSIDRANSRDDPLVGQLRSRIRVALFVPKSIVCLKEGYTRERLLRDLIAGVVVGIVALPLALAFAIASGVPPERGLFTAIIGGF